MILIELQLRPELQRPKSDSGLPEPDLEQLVV